MLRRLSVIFFLLFNISACSSVGVPTGPEAYSIIPAPAKDDIYDDYKIGPLDALKITVFQEPDLSLEEVPVNASGTILFPLIGKVEAAGKTSSELADDIARRLGDRFLVNPQVSLIVAESASQKVTVEGSVKTPGVYPIEGQTTLLTAMALAQGPTQTAHLDEIVIFRRIDDKTFGAAFDLSAIRRGTQEDPEIRGGDIVVVGHSFLKGAFRDFLTTAPLLTSLFIQISR